LATIFGSKVARRLQVELAEVALQLLPALPVARVPVVAAGGIMLFVAEMLGQLRAEGAFQHCLG